MLKNVKCARCVKCGKEYEAVPNLTNCECGGIQIGRASCRERV